jgi:predicted amidohydrolase YtcJ
MIPDIIIHNAHAITFCPDEPRAEAIAIYGRHIVAVGPSADVLVLSGPSTRLIDARGATVVPGLTDSHVHLFGGSVELDCLNLHGVSGLAALKDAVLPYASAHPADDIVFCVMADYHILGEDIPMTRKILDDVLPDRPLALFAPDHHTIWANTAALQATGLLHGGEVEAGSEIVMAADGLASGTLLEPGAYGPILNLTRHKGRDMLGLTTGKDPDPPATPAEREMDKDAIARGLEHCARHGITTLHLMDGNAYQLELLAELEAEGRLCCRCHVPFHMKGTDPLDRLTQEAPALRERYQGDKLRCSHVKMFIDGVIDSGTALMLRPYPGALGKGGNAGQEVFTQDHFVGCCTEADRLGFQIAVHAIGDLGVRRTIDAFAAAAQANGTRDTRHRIEHIEVIHPDDLPRLAPLGIVASLQPGHSPAGHVFPPDGIEDCFHPDQIACAFAWQTLREHAQRVVFSTDWPVIPVDVMANFKAAMAPLDLGTQWPDQTQSLTNTLASYTLDAAWVEFNEARKGQLRPGMLADVTIFSYDLTTLAPDDITQARPVVTICDGQITYARNP